MSQATRLTRSGKLKDAVAAIQAALRRSPIAAPVHTAPAPSAEVADVVDVQAREVADNSPAALADSFISGSHSDKAGTRDYKLYIPPAQPGPAGPGLPLVVMLHGCTQNPDDFAAGTRMNKAAAQQGCYVLYPAQTAAANPQRCWNWFKHNHQQRDRGEPAILAGMVRSVIRQHTTGQHPIRQHPIGQHPIDPRRVYVAGLSAGGAMAAILGQAYPDVFAAVGVHSGLPTGAASDVTSALMAMRGGMAGPLPAAFNPTTSTPAVPANVAARPPTIVFHGDQDSTVHPVNGERAAATAATAAPPEVRQVSTPDGRTSTQRISRDASGRITTEHWVVHGAGHAWAGGSGLGSYTDAQGPDATHEMLRFFATHRLPDRLPVAH